MLHNVQFWVLIEITQEALQIRMLSPIPTGSDWICLEWDVNNRIFKASQMIP
jgi:hypothetical protein